MTKVEEIRVAILLELHVADLVDTSLNRLTYLIRLKKRWMAKTGPRTAKKMEYFEAINREIKRLEYELEKNQKKI